MKRKTRNWESLPKLVRVALIWMAFLVAICWFSGAFCVGIDMIKRGKEVQGLLVSLHPWLLALSLFIYEME